MKAILKLKLTLGLLFTLNLHSTIINHQSFNLYAQDPELFEHTWYFEIGELDETVFFPTDNLTAELEIYPNDILIGYPYCEGGLSFEDIEFDLNNTTFEILGESIILVDNCVGPDYENEVLFMNKHNLIYSDYQNTGIVNNPFTYTIETVDEYSQLTITNGEGDWAVYNSVLLSNQGFNQNNFTIYPNPVKETLHINNGLKQQVTAIIYDVSGKEFQKYSFDGSNETMDVKALNPGFYFVVFENETGKRVSKKFIKQ